MLVFGKKLDYKDIGYQAYPSSTTSGGCYGPVHELAEAKRQSRLAYELMKSLNARIYLRSRRSSALVPSSTTSASSWPTKLAR